MLEERIKEHFKNDTITYQEGMDIIEEMKALDSDIRKNLLCLILDNLPDKVHDSDPIFIMILKNFKEELISISSKISDESKPWELGNEILIIDDVIEFMEITECRELVCKKMNTDTPEVLLEIMREYFINTNDTILTLETSEKMLYYHTIIFDIDKLIAEWEIQNP